MCIYTVTICSSSIHPGYRETYTTFFLSHGYTTFSCLTVTQPFLVSRSHNLFFSHGSQHKVSSLCKVQVYNYNHSNLTLDADLQYVMPGLMLLKANPLWNAPSYDYDNLSLTSQQTSCRTGFAHVRALIDGKAVVGKCHRWKADISHEETAALAVLLLSIWG